MQSNQRAILLKQMALVSSSGSPMLFICMLALAGVHIQLWMILVACVATFGMLITGAMAAAKLSSTKQMRSLQGDTISGITTTGTKFQEDIAPLKWTKKPEGAHVDIVVHGQNRRQMVLGFGGALTGASCYVLNRLAAPDRAKIMLELFHPQQGNLNVTRVSMGSSDYHPELYSYCDQPGIEHFSIDRDRAYILPMLKLARKINPNMFMFASPWSPPGWMKPNGTMLGGAMANTHFDAYAEYFTKFLEAYRAEGLEVQAVTVQNEVEADQGGKMPACTWTRELESEFVTGHLGPALAALEQGTEIWLMDHNFDMAPRAIDALDDMYANGRFSQSIAWHGYGGSADAVSQVKAKWPTSEHHFTEFNTFIDAPDYWSNWTYWGTQIGEAMRNWCRSYTMWNIALDEHGKPNIGPFTCGGVVTIDSATGEMKKSGGFYGLTHYSRYVRRGGVVVESTGDVDKLTHVAFLNRDGTKVLVLSNAGAKRDVVVEYDGSDKVFTVSLDADSVTTLVWA